MSTVGIEDTLRTRLLTHERLSGATLATILGTAAGAGSDGKLYKNEAPDNVTGPYAVMWFKNRRPTPDVAVRQTAELEVQIFGRPRSMQATCEEAADACDEAMLTEYTDVSSRVISCSGGLRSAMPPASEPADREVVQIRLVYTLIVYPENIAQYSDT